MPSLSTATKLAHGLREVHDQADPPRYLGLFSSGSTNPTARVWYALGADESLSEVHARQIMEHYLALRSTIESVPGHPIPAVTATAARLEGTRTRLGRP
jgi:hypothetical protein